MQLRFPDRQTSFFFHSGLDAGSALDYIVEAVTRFLDPNWENSFIIDPSRAPGLSLLRTPYRSLQICQWK